jgi:hypothetical protein
VILSVSLRRVIRLSQWFIRKLPYFKMYNKRYVIQYVNVCVFWFFSIQTEECANSPICDILHVHVTWVREKKNWSYIRYLSYFPLTFSESCWTRSEQVILIILKGVDDFSYFSLILFILYSNIRIDITSPIFFFSHPSNMYM